MRSNKVSNCMYMVFTMVVLGGSFGKDSYPHRHRHHKQEGEAFQFKGNIEDNLDVLSNGIKGGGNYFIKDSENKWYASKEHVLKSKEKYAQSKASKLGYMLFENVEKATHIGDDEISPGSKTKHFTNIHLDEEIRKKEIDNEYEKASTAVPRIDESYNRGGVHNNENLDENYFESQMLMDSGQVGFYPKYINIEHVVQKEVEKELLDHSIAFLKGRLVKCMQKERKTSGRNKRKVDHDFDFISLELETEMLENSQEYLKSRLVHCQTRLRSSGNTKYHTRDSWSNYENIPLEKAPSKDHRYDDLLYQDNVAYTPQSNQIMTKTSETPTTPTPPPTLSHQVSRWIIPLSNHEIYCDEMVIINNSTLQLRNVNVQMYHRIDNAFRFPNQDVCITYNQYDWRDSSSLQPRVREVLDLQNLCNNVAQVVKVWGYVLRIRVIWGCGEVENRVKWLSGSFAGSIEDNGFLHDLECTFSDRIPSISKFRQFKQ